MVGVLLVCIVAQGLLAVFEVIPSRLMQPVSALYMVPFMVFGLSRRSKTSLLLLWPGLYGLHAILILASAPILFTGRWDALNLFLPSSAYGILAGAGALLYSRFALYRLRRLASSS
ncbi:MAG: hypothetical protein LAP40_15885 [Acidobacteriia bacterium]|nr:hypothetical protein [Terriglobia bacterium]